MQPQSTIPSRNQTWLAGKSPISPSGICQQPAMFDDIKMDQPISISHVDMLIFWLLSSMKYPHENSTMKYHHVEKILGWSAIPRSAMDFPWISHGGFQRSAKRAFPRQHFQTFEVTPKPILSDKAFGGPIERI